MKKISINIISKILLLIIVTVFSNNGFYAHADTIESYNLQFNQSDYSIECDNNGDYYIKIINEELNYSFPKPGNPLIPVLSKGIVIPASFSFSSVTSSIQKTTVKTGISMKSCEYEYPTNFLDSIDRKQPPKIAEGIYPRFPIDYSHTSKFNTFNLINLNVSPFIYDAEAKELYFINSINIQLSLKEKEANIEKKDSPTSLSIVKSLAINAGRLDSLQSENETRKIISSNSNEIIKYVIITSNSLKSAFEPLRLWKHKKGISARIITIEEIENEYSGNTTQLKIKKCLKNLVENNGLTYALLGGDESVVPVQKCYGVVEDYDGSNDRIDPNIPSDLYYSCFNGNFEWDANNNGIYGEINDNINFIPSLYITRAPIRNASQTQSFINKIINYETNPVWKNNILLCGAIIQNYNQYGKSDTELKGETLYNQYISPYWNGQRIRFYDTYTDISGNGDYDFDTNNFSTQFNSGYNFIDIMTHGNIQNLQMEIGYFFVWNAENLNNTCHSIITTTACHTNKFDYSENGTPYPCLGEIFIRNYNSGIIGYIGSSSEGWDSGSSNGSANPDLGASPMINAEFYKKLFSNSSNPDKKFGEVIGSAKSARVGYCNEYTSHRWVQLAVNPLGDPEMPVFTSEPLFFNKKNISFENGNLEINTNINSCNVALMSIPDNGSNLYQVFDKVNSLTFPSLSSKHISICFTKQNYIPKINTVKIFRNETVSGNLEIESDIVAIGSNVLSNSDNGEVIFSSGNIKILSPEVIFTKDVEIKKGVELKISNN